MLGKNGAVKSTLIKAIAGLIPRLQGHVRFRGKALNDLRHEVAFLPQRERVDWNFPFSVQGLVETGRYPQLGPWRRFRPSDREAVDRAIHAMRLDDLRNRQIRQLSGGQQQRTFIARALAQEPHVLLLDEPFAGLDQNAVSSLGDLLRELVEARHLVIASHHDLDSVPTLFEPDLAASQGIPVRAVDYALMGLTVLALVTSLQAVGCILSLGLMVAPAATVQLFARSPRNLFLGGAMIGSGVSLLAVFASNWLDVPTGATIVVLLAALFMGALAVRTVMDRIHAHHADSSA